MSIRIRSRSIGTLIGGDLAVDIIHTEDSVRIGDGSNLMGPFTNSGGTYCIPVDVKAITGDIATATKQSDGSQKTQLVDASANVGEFDDVGGEKALKVSVIASVGGGGGGTAATDSAAYTAGASQFTPIGGAFDDTAPDALAEGEMGMARVSSARSLHIKLQEVGSVTVPVSGTFWQATQPVSAASLPLPTGAATEATLASLLTSSQLLDDMIATLGAAIPAKAALVAGSDGTDARALKVDAAGELQIDVVSSALPSGAATSAKQDTAQTALDAIKTAVEIIDNAISGSEMQVDVLTLPNVTIGSISAGDNNIGNVDIASIAAGDNNIGNVDIVSMPDAVCVGKAAHDAAVSGNPVRIGAYAYNTSITNVAAGDTVNLIADKQGALIVQPIKPREFVRTQVTTITNTSETTIVTAGGAGVFNDIVAMVITNNSDVQSTCTIKDSTGGTTRMTFLVPARGGVVFQPACPLAQQAAANNNWTATMGTTATSTNISVMYVINT